MTDPAITLRTAHRRDAKEIGAVLGRAFAEDPVLRWMLPDQRRSSRMFAALIRRQHLPNGGSEIAADASGPVGAAIWDPPGYRPTTLETLLTLPGLAASMRRRLPAGAALETAFAKVRPKEPHWYLAQIGTDPAARGRGVGGTLLRSRLARCDADAIPAYLESSNKSNIPLYEKFGFTVTGEIQLPKGPSCWAMWRESR
ncbi:MAG TPA: GNAT family N-acetyltransferase [Mycobacteriales bacterium]|jgi:ribosomal protein S18 acetylase RimI-like enzyme|nr:GNAT family N-acetyltransferase [Mycobacteriales bacterium]